MHRRSREAKVSVLVDWMRLRIPWAIVVRYGLHINVDNMWSHLMRYKSLATVPHPPPKSILKPTMSMPPLQEIPAHRSSRRSPKKSSPPKGKQSDTLIDFNIDATSGPTVSGTDSLPNPFQVERSATVNETRVILRTEEEQQAAARDREEREGKSWKKRPTRGEMRGGNLLPIDEYHLHPRRHCILGMLSLNTKIPQSPQTQQIPHGERPPPPVQLGHHILKPQAHQAHILLSPRPPHQRKSKKRQ